MMYLMVWLVLGGRPWDGERVAPGDGGPCRCPPRLSACHELPFHLSGGAAVTHILRLFEQHRVPGVTSGPSHSCHCTPGGLESILTLGLALVEGVKIQPLKSVGARWIGR